MGYSGPPSKACLLCRRRRIKVGHLHATNHFHTLHVLHNLLSHSNQLKCDLATPACSQCLRAGKVCEGYRHSVDFLFRDQNRAVAATVQGSTHKPTQGRHTPLKWTKQVSAAKPSQLCQSQGFLTPPPPASAEDQAACFFFDRYVTRQVSEQPQCLHAYLPGLYSVEAKHHMLKNIVTAIGLTGISHQKNDPKMLLAADASYYSAVRQTNKALRSSVTATSDQTLISVLLLGLYEASFFYPYHQSEPG